MKLAKWIGRGNPEYPVVMLMERFHDGIDYFVSVSDSGTTLGDSINVWHRSVGFTRKNFRRDRGAFVEVAREQQKVADAWVAHIAKVWA